MVLLAFRLVREVGDNSPSVRVIGIRKRNVLTERFFFFFVNSALGIWDWKHSALGIRDQKHSALRIQNSEMYTEAGNFASKSEYAWLNAIIYLYIVQKMEFHEIPKR
ncbi:hypothetical protein C1645_744518 [Glomus cerebriforme]|uniref:Uncharacterized protein n=1 Tax=Glomus cerebriforme TaxID=658196 RepID=A0A397S4V6_9GLOM|nr:hypothetical protein C1645_744518 [Glomus cerebriforme]